ncbi:hypothetical protein ABEH87_05750 [Erwinia sp. Eh17-17]|jgi:hypothetical protein|uniref:hypothetical protein n=1 Tax=Erwinia sp. Eh17-17 TaxID=3080330 RepID=UPI00320AAEFA
MATIIWKAAAPQGTCRSRYKARRAAAVAARHRDKRLQRKIGALLGQQTTVALTPSWIMQQAFPAGQECTRCGLPRPSPQADCWFCAVPPQQDPDRQ